VSDESIYSGLLEYPQYSKPREYDGDEVPEILLSGNHGEIDLWRWEESLKLTKDRRPDLFEAYLASEPKLSKREQKILDKYR
jgi:tRNA (guanine37-N1)-methyltransferase